MLINFLLFLMIILRLWTAVALFMAGRQNKLPNLYWLAGAFAVFATAVAFAPTAGNPLGTWSGSLWVFAAGNVPSMAMTSLFVSKTFYPKRSSPLPWMLGIVTVLGGLTLWGVALSTSAAQQHPLVASIQVLICVVFGWQGWAGYQAWRGVANEKMVEDWVKGRYQLIIGYSGCQFAASLCSFVRIVGAGGSTASTLGNVMALVTLVANIGVVILSYLAWAAPRNYYQWLNRNYKALEVKDFDEEEIMRQMMAQ